MGRQAGRESASSCLSFPLFVHFSFSPITISVTDFLASMRAKVFKFCIHFESGQVYCGKENQDAEINFCLLFPFLLFSISHPNVVHREIWVKYFSGTTAPRILKFGTNVGYDLLHCVRESASWCLPFPLFVQFSFCPIKFPVTDFLASMRARVFKFLIHLESGQVYCETENQDAEIYFYHLFPFSLSSISHSNVCS